MFVNILHSNGNAILRGNIAINLLSQSIAKIYNWEAG